MKQVAKVREYRHPDGSLGDLKPREYRHPDGSLGDLRDLGKRAPFDSRDPSDFGELSRAVAVAPSG
jgi:hypothetical protein